jgi:hypothetical protein
MLLIVERRGAGDSRGAGCRRPRPLTPVAVGLPRPARICFVYLRAV